MQSIQLLIDLLDRGAGYHTSILINQGFTVSFDDVLSEAGFVMAKTLKTYTEDKGSYKTYFYTSLNNRIISFKNELCRKKVPEYRVDEINHPTGDYGLLIDEIERELTKTEKKAFDHLVYGKCHDLNQDNYRSQVMNIRKKAKKVMEV